MQINTQVQFLYSLGVILLALGALFAGSFNPIFDRILDKSLILTPENEILKSFIKPPIPITMEYYLFNVTNPEAVQFDGAKPILKEMGPYTYLKYELKEKIDFSSSKGTVEYEKRETFFFNEELSVGSETDNITTVNPILVILGNKMSSMNPLFQNIGGWLFMGFESPTDLFITKTVGELLFHGYHDPVVDFLSSVTGDPKLAEGKFAFFQQMNGSIVGTFKVNTGADDINEHLFFRERNGKTNLDFFDTPTCNMINGTDAKQFPPRVNKSNILQAYGESICRSIDLSFKEEVELNGVKTYKFGPTDDLYAIGIPENQCFCRDKWFCADGLIDISNCKEGAPVILSGPHFRGVDPFISDRVEGLTPSNEKHETVIYVEPVTGIVMKAAMRLQVNFPITRYGSITAFQNVNDFVLPIFWVFEGATVPPDLVEQVKQIITSPFLIAYPAAGAVMLIGLIIIIVGFWKDSKKDGKGDYHRQDI